MGEVTRSHKDKKSSGLTWIGSVYADLWTLLESRL